MDNIIKRPVRRGK